MNVYFVINLYRWGVNRARWEKIQDILWHEFNYSHEKARWGSS